MKIFITGLNGFIAGHLARHLALSGHEVTGSSRTLSPLPGARIWALGDPPDEGMFRGIEALIHCAHDFRRRAIHVNVDGTLALANAARRSGVKSQIFLSSLSARGDATSEYGRAKFAIERVLLERGDTVVRPGTVVGKGGVLGKMARMIETKSVLPLVDGGKTPMAVIGIADLCLAIEAIVGRAEPREYNLYYPEKPTLKELLVQLEKRLGKETFFLPVPAWALYVPLWTLDWLHIRTSIDLENLKGYMKSKEIVYSSNLSLVVQNPGGIKEALKGV